MFNILYPIAGFGSRFANQGFKELKPFIKIKDKYIIEYSLSSLRIPGKYYIVVRNLEKKYIKILNEIFNKYDIDGHIIDIKTTTKGAAETCILTENYVDSSKPMFITNCDQYTPWNPNAFIEFINNNDYDSIVTTFNHEPIILNTFTKYSFIKIDNNKLATEFSEKLAISNLSLNGIHYWKSGKMFFNSAKMLLEDESINQEKYISLTFNYLIKLGYKISYYPMNADTFYSLGTPEEVKKNLEFL